MESECIAVLPLAQLPPGTMAYVEVDGLPIALANDGGTVLAFSDVCRHEGGSLASGALIDGTVTCPWHGWTYDIRSGKSLVPPIGLRIPTYPVTVVDAMIHVTVSWPVTE